MDDGALAGTEHGLQKAGHDLVTKQKQSYCHLKYYFGLVLQVFFPFLLLLFFSCDLMTNKFYISVEKKTKY